MRRLVQLVGALADPDRADPLGAGVDPLSHVGVSAALRFAALQREVAWRTFADGTAGPFPLRDVAAKLRVHPGSVCRALRSLTADGWITTAPFPGTRPPNRPPRCYAVAENRVLDGPDFGRVADQRGTCVTLPKCGVTRQSCRNFRNKRTRDKRLVVTGPRRR